MREALTSMILRTDLGSLLNYTNMNTVMSYFNEATRNKAITALENKMTPDTTIEDKPFKLGDWQPQNYDRTFRGTVSMRQTAINSLNIPTIRLAEKLSIDKVLLSQ